jgi:hypothetical protein
MMEEYLPSILASSTYKKFGNVNARRLRYPEKIFTFTIGTNGKELETIRVGKPGDYVVKNPTGEEYIIDKDIFETRYTHKFFNIYIPKGEIKAIEYLGSDMNFYAGWGEKMILRKGDYLASPSPLYNEIYRIGRFEFFKTYKEI